MYYVYVLRGERDKKLYIGCTKDLRQRLAMHNSGKVPATNLREPLRLIFYEAYINKTDAFAREKWLKTGWGRNQLRKVLSNFLKI